MSLLFGRLTQSFIVFTIASSKGVGLEEARISFEAEAAKDALYLTLIGEYQGYHH